MQIQKNELEAVFVGFNAFSVSEHIYAANLLSNIFFALICGQIQSRQRSRIEIKTST